MCAAGSHQTQFRMQTQTDHYLGTSYPRESCPHSPVDLFTPWLAALSSPPRCLVSHPWWGSQASKAVACRVDPSLDRSRRQRNQRRPEPTLGEVFGALKDQIGLRGNLSQRAAFSWLSVLSWARGSRLRSMSSHRTTRGGMRPARTLEGPESDSGYWPKDAW